MLLNVPSFLKPVLMALLLTVSALAMALPTPKDIETAVREGHMAQAESMLREVIQEKPQSAKAHYELGQVLAREARYPEALTELKQAKTIDPTLKFAGSDAQFNSVFDKVSAAATPAVTHSAPATTSVQAAPVPQAPATSGSSSLSYIWIAIALVVVVAWLARRFVTSNPPSGGVMQAPMQPAMQPQPARGFGAQFTPNQPGYGPQGYAPQAPSGGSTMTGAVVGGLAGVAAGYALSKALEGDHHSSNAPAADHNNANGGYVPFDAPARPDLGSFDAGSGSGWDDSGSSDSGGGDDNW
ncbi:tetratricopeptide repeat protein [Limnohabitans sp.]|uniref:tetratricopeptide repeat protein n=1 Tax=Limnohabitans sp. TaxID=1907725 RepID=UPI0038BCAE9A